MPVALVDRWPQLPVETLIAGLVPPPLFAGVSFDSYRPDPAEPSQAVARAAVARFAELVRPGASRGRRGWSRRRQPADRPAGIYLDGGFGVGKTHLLAALWHAVPGPKAYATFLELTQLVGALGFAETVARLSPMTLLAIDEFELDDPGDTVLVSSLLGRLDSAGVRLAATSNTLPDRLGEQRFAAEDFRREIQALAARFTTVRVDGPDYRHRGLPEPPAPLAEDRVRQAAGHPGASLDSFPELLEHLARLHPSRYGALLDGINRVCLTGVAPAPDEHMALRLVVLADRLYDRQLPLACSGEPLDRLFGPEMLAGGYRTKYRRAISRLVALARLA
ncbi:cell division protein ZapE [Jatrophihabitans sp.]|uniref:cell division protein ZapE n=1 Tax=Jatrophihabitans sp. TaxID=1932789 RepID=UPI002CF60F4F|nr:cell division protein ZapE [Jatrophihabitans sp.]